MVTHVNKASMTKKKKKKKKTWKESHNKSRQCVKKAKTSL